MRETFLNYNIHGFKYLVDVEMYEFYKFKLEKKPRFLEECNKRNVKHVTYGTYACMNVTLLACTSINNKTKTNTIVESSIKSAWGSEVELVDIENSVRLACMIFPMSVILNSWTCWDKLNILLLEYIHLVLCSVKWYLISYWLASNYVPMIDICIYLIRSKNFSYLKTNKCSSSKSNACEKDYLLFG